MHRHAASHRKSPYRKKQCTCLLEDEEHTHVVPRYFTIKQVTTNQSFTSILKTLEIWRRYTPKKNVSCHLRLKRHHGHCKSYKRKLLIGVYLQFHRVGLLSSRWASWRQAGKHGVGEEAESCTLILKWRDGDRVWGSMPGPGVDTWDLKFHHQPRETVLPTRAYRLLLLILSPSPTPWWLSLQSHASLALVFLSAEYCTSD